MLVRPFPVNHPQGAHGFRIEVDGASLVYATDYEHGSPSHDEGLREVASGADVLISDAQYTPDEYALRRAGATRPGSTRPPWPPRPRASGGCCCSTTTRRTTTTRWTGSARGAGAVPGDGVLATEGLEV